MKKSTRFLITLCMIFSLVFCFATGISAASYPVWVGGVQFTDANCTSGIPCGNGVATLKAGNGVYTLTLENAEITGGTIFQYNGNTYSSGILVGKDCELVLKGHNQFSVFADYGTFATELHALQDLTIRGDGDFSASAIKVTGDLKLAGSGKIAVGQVIQAEDMVVDHQYQILADWIATSGSYTQNSGYVYLDRTYSGAPALIANGMITINGGALDAKSYYAQNVNVMESNEGIKINIPATYLYAFENYTLDPSTLKVDSYKDPYDFSGERKIYHLLGAVEPGYSNCYVQHAVIGNPYAVFSDEPSWAWAEPYIIFNIDNGLMNGLSKTYFGAADTVTRAQLVTILYRMAGSPDLPEGAEKDAFVDVADGQWYTDAIRWAYANGITKGYSDTLFGTNDKVKRQDVVTFFWRYEGEPFTDNDLNAFADASAVSDYARTAMGWAVDNGIINGVTPTTLDPTGTALRGQLAKIISVYAQTYHSDEDWIVK
ncbi:MAG: S-layer homology domain-containing protein [Firmicutes bacterium]|nr:S-layer homology domain-containing protein [Bacillota bacterium]